MRIAFVVGKFPKLSKTFILSQITGLIDYGHEVDVYAVPDNEKINKLHGDIEKYRLSEKIFYLKNIPENPVKKTVKSLACLLSLAPSNFSQLLRLASLPESDFDHKLDTWIFASMPALRGKSYDIIHCHFAEHGRSALLLKSAGLSKAKVVTTFHGYDVNVTTPKCNPKAYKEIFAEGNIFTANTQFTAKKAVLMGCPLEKISILPVGLDIDKYKFLPRQWQPGEPIRVLTVGRLVEKKGIDYSIRAIAKALQQRPDLNIEYSIIGEGPQRDSLEALAESLNIAEKVKLLGGMTQEEVRSMYEASHLFMLSSVTATNGDMEGQGLVLQEAQCMGLPVMSTLHNGIPDGVLDGQSGFLVPEKDVDALAEKLIYLSSHTKDWMRMGQAGHEFVKSRYNIRELNSQLINLYKSLLLHGS